MYLRAWIWAPSHVNSSWTYASETSLRLLSMPCWICLRQASPIWRPISRWVPDTFTSGGGFGCRGILEERGLISIVILVLFLLVEIDLNYNIQLQETKTPPLGVRGG